jgi:predicted site-specific integrase-resolvase
MTEENRSSISTGEAGKRIGLNSKTLRRWVDTGKVEGFKSPKGMRYVYSDSLDKIIESRKQG